MMYSFEKKKGHMKVETPPIVWFFSLAKFRWFLFLMIIKCFPKHLFCTSCFSGIAVKGHYKSLINVISMTCRLRPLYTTHYLLLLGDLLGVANTFAI